MLAVSSRFFVRRQHGADSADSAVQDRLGNESLVLGLVSMYDAHICKCWLPEAFRQLQPKLSFYQNQLTSIAKEASVWKDLQHIDIQPALNAIWHPSKHDPSWVTRHIHRDGYAASRPSENLHILV